MLQPCHLADTACERAKALVLPLALAEIARAQLPGSGATLLHYASAGSRVKGAHVDLARAARGYRVWVGLRRAAGRSYRRNERRRSMYIGIGTIVIIVIIVIVVLALRRR